ncbi:zinc finger (C3HC4 type RING finger) protein, putative [Eimeria acervulina]|uniref:Zinc finger (C3HC4 type RING finger) protein, putative n=1 Tax=Eimeria acervulina TaxID=5801 RepID=U6GH50_EIMAC|nr:zinc finger (C3HC4 type RING finger) protein, putative [Eimeria acervulina]CDI79556.1 zinc finger (C3HC4 type RING finger) protein, putative [Eimeria acervulina]
MAGTGTAPAASAGFERSSASGTAAPGAAATAAGGGAGSAAAPVGDESATIPSGFLGTLVPVRRTFIEEVPEDLRCPICYDGAANCSTRCGHSFCLHCLYSHITTRIIHQQSTACPLCRSANAGLGISTVSGEKYARARALRVRCLGYEGGCSVEGPLAEVEQHEVSCPTVLIFCRFRDAGCSTPVLRKEASLHENRCRFNPAVRCCQHYLSGCRVRGIEELLQQHEPRCRYRNMQKFVSCRHASLGCGLRVRKQYRERHADCCAFKILHELKLKRRQQQQQQLLLQGAPSGAVSSAPAGEGSTEGAAAATEGAAQACSSAEAAAAAGAAAADASSAAAAAVQASSAGAPAATEAPAATAAAAEATAADAGSKMSDDCADLCLALQWSSQQQVLPNELLLLRLQEFLPNVAAITEGRFPGEFHVVLRQQVHTRTAAAVANAAVPAAGTAVSDVRSIGMAGDPNMSSNLSGLGLLYKGLTTLQAP